MLKPKIKTKLNLDSLTKPFLVIGVAIVLSITSLITPLVKADKYDQQISELKQQNAATQSNVNQLQIEASSYQDAIARLQQQINGIQNAIVTNQAKQADLQIQITNAEAELAHERIILGESIKKMYLEGQISTLEMLATSKDLSEFVDKQQYRSSVQDKIKTTVDKITALKLALKTQKVQVDQLIVTQQAQQAQLDSDRAQQNQLLALNEQQQSQYNQQIKDNSGKIAKLRSEQAAAIAAIARAARVSGVNGGGSGGNCDSGQGNGGYVAASGGQGNVCDARKDDISDKYGIPNRECTSYAYWYMNDVLGKPFTARGDAKYWVNTSSRGSDRNPEAGTIGVWPVGEWGHVMIVQAVGPTTFGGANVPAGYVMVSNMNGDYAGHFSYNLWPANSLYYIH